MCVLLQELCHLILNFITGLRLLGATTDLNVAGSLMYANDVIDIYSNSWGPCDYGCVGGPLRLTQMALRIGAERVSICIACMNAAIATNASQSIFCTYRGCNMQANYRLNQQH